MHYLHGFLCEHAFSECRDLLLKPKTAAFDVHGARQVLARTTLYNDILADYGLILAELLTNLVSEKENVYIETDAQLLADFIQHIATGSIGSSLLSQEIKGETDFPDIAFIAMDEYNDCTLQGLEFVRVFMRTSLQFEARKAAGYKPTPLDEVIARLSHTAQVHPALIEMTIERLENPTNVLDYLAHAFSEKNNPLKNTAFHGFVAELVARGHAHAEHVEHQS